MADAFATRLLAWWEDHGRKDLPWQRERTLYRVWVSEVMLQQTQVGTVLGYFERFMARFPDPTTLADAPLDEVLHLWAGLGYYARARNLHRAAAVVRDAHGGALPAEFAALAELPGIGRSTAGAILALGADARHPILDGNAERVLARYHAVAGWPKHAAVARKLWTWAEKHLPTARVADYTQALMDLGATLCTRRKPACALCPLSPHCLARARGIEERLPEPRPKRHLPLRHARLVVARRGDQVLLEQRPPTGVWGGLWSLPELEPAGDARAWARVLGCEATLVRALPILRHSFSHFRLEAEPMLLRVASGGARVEQGGWLWYNLRAPQRVGLPKPVAKLLATLLEEGDGADGPLFGAERGR